MFTYLVLKITLYSILPGVVFKLTSGEGPDNPPRLVLPPGSPLAPPGKPGRPPKPGGRLARTPLLVGVSPV